MAHAGSSSKISLKVKCKCCRYEYWLDSLGFFFRKESESEEKATDSFVDSFRKEMDQLLDEVEWAYLFPIDIETAGKQSLQSVRKALDLVERTTAELGDQIESVVKRANLLNEEMKELSEKVFLLEKRTAPLRSTCTLVEKQLALVASRSTRPVVIK